MRLGFFATTPQIRKNPRIPAEGALGHCEGGRQVSAGWAHKKNEQYKAFEMARAMPGEIWGNGGLKLLRF